MIITHIPVRVRGVRVHARVRVRVRVFVHVCVCHRLMNSLIEKGKKGIAKTVLSIVS